MFSISLTDCSLIASTYTCEQWMICACHSTNMATCQLSLWFSPFIPMYHTLVLKSASHFINNLVCLSDVCIKTLEIKRRRMWRTLPICQHNCTIQCQCWTRLASTVTSHDTYCWRNACRMYVVHAIFWHRHRHWHLVGRQDSAVQFPEWCYGNIKRLGFRSSYRRRVRHTKGFGEHGRIPCGHESVISR